MIRWTYTSRSLTPSSIDLITQSPNRLHIVNTSFAKNDGIYKCHYGNEFQVRKMKKKKEEKLVSLRIEFLTKRMCILNIFIEHLSCFTGFNYTISVRE